MSKRTAIDILELSTHRNAVGDATGPHTMAGGEFSQEMCRGVA